mgnify:CR=1 FL=1
MFRRFLSRNWEICLFFIIAHLLLFSLELTSDASEGASAYPLVRFSFQFLDWVRLVVLPYSYPISIALAICYVALPLDQKLRRFLVDFFGAWFSIRIAHLFFLINLLLFLPLTEHTLAIGQLLLFMPCLLLMWGWIYWRMNLHELEARGKPKIGRAHV